MLLFISAVVLNGKSSIGGDDSIGLQGLYRFSVLFPVLLFVLRKPDWHIVEQVLHYH